LSNRVIENWRQAGIFNCSITQLHNPEFPVMLTAA
jgi:hypothetical protein